MERLPYIDEHAIAIGAPRERVWEALIATLHRFGRTVPRVIAVPWGLAPARLQGDWQTTPQPGDCLPGFTVERSQPPRSLALRGRHRFSRYALIFELEAAGDAGCKLRAQTYAEFPGLAGRAYRTLVIASGGHRLAVRRLLRDVARRA